MAAEEQFRSLEETPIWAVSIVCFVLILLSLLIEQALQLLTKFIKRRKRKSLRQAIRKIETELMIMGFMSLLLSVAEGPISKICVSKAVGNSFLPCKDIIDDDNFGHGVSMDTEKTNTSSGGSGIEDISSCERKGMVSLVSREGTMHLQIFIFVLAAFHVLYCLLTMFLGTAQMRRWKRWEEEVRTLEYQIENDPRRFRLTSQTSFGRRHLKFWSDHHLLLWPVCFLRQFTGSVTKADYFTLRNGFIIAHFSEESDYDFQKFLARAFDRDFVKVVVISFWIWMFSILFIFFSAQDFYNHFWLPFIPLLMTLIVGTKLEVIITRMCLESPNKTTVVQGSVLVKPKDNLFWFGRPHWLLYLIHFILFQNSFQLAFFTWTWYEYGLRSCFHRETEEIVLRIVMGVLVQFLCGYVTLPLYALVTQYEYGLRSCFHRETEEIVLRIVMGVLVQFLCGYVTLPLYALVTQMGTDMKSEVFTESILKGLKHWHRLAQQNLSRNKSLSTTKKRDSLPTDPIGNTFSDAKELDSPDHDHLPPLSLTKTPKITEDMVKQMIITRETYGEISFGTSWKELGNRKLIADITSEIDEIASDIS